VSPVPAASLPAAAIDFKHFFSLSLSLSLSLSFFKNIIMIIIIIDVVVLERRWGRDSDGAPGGYIEIR